MLVIRRLKQLGGFLGTDDSSSGQHLRRLAGFRETIRHFSLDGVHEKAATDGAAGCHGGFEAFDPHHGITNRGAGVENDVGEVLELLAVAVAAGASLAVGGADDGGDLHPALLKLLGHLDGNDVAATAGDDEGAVAGLEVEVAQDAIGKAADVFEEHGLTLAIRAHDEVVEGQREFDDGIEARKRTVTRPHLLDEDAAVAGTEDVDHLTGEDGLCEQVGGLLD